MYTNVIVVALTRLTTIEFHSASEGFAPLTNEMIYCVTKRENVLTEKLVYMGSTECTDQTRFFRSTELVQAFPLHQD